MEIIGAAIYPQTGTPAEEISKDEWKDFVLLPPENAGAISSLAICTVRENERETRFYTPHFGRINPQKLLDAAINRASEAGITAAEALHQMDLNLPEVESHVTATKAILGPGSGIAEKLYLLMSSSPITDAHITMDADGGIAAVKMNPLWEKLRNERESGPPARRLFSFKGPPLGCFSGFHPGISTQCPHTLRQSLVGGPLIEQRFRSAASEHPKTFSGKTRSPIPCTETRRGHSKFTTCSRSSAVWWMSTPEYRRCHAEASAPNPKC